MDTSTEVTSDCQKRRGPQQWGPLRYLIAGSNPLNFGVPLGAGGALRGTVSRQTFKPSRHARADVHYSRPSRDGRPWHAGHVRTVVGLVAAGRTRDEIPGLRDWPVSSRGMCDTPASITSPRSPNIATQSPSAPKGDTRLYGKLLTAKGEVETRAYDGELAWGAPILRDALVWASSDRAAQDGGIQRASRPRSTSPSRGLVA